MKINWEQSGYIFEEGWFMVFRGTVRPSDARYLGNEKKLYGLNSCSSNSCNLSYLIELGQDHQPSG